MFKVIDKLHIGNMCCVSIEGDIQILKNGLVLSDENKNIFKIETIAMTKHQSIEDYKKYAEVVLSGNIESMGEILFLDV